MGEDNNACARAIQLHVPDEIPWVPLNIRDPLRSRKHAFATVIAWLPFRAFVQEASNFWCASVRSFVRPSVSCHQFGPLFGPWNVQYCFKIPNRGVKQMENEVSPTKIKVYKKIASWGDQDLDLFVGTFDMTSVTSRFWGSPAQKPWRATLPCRCNLVLFVREN